ncbi:MAG: hypothetical protein K0S95_2246 [Pantoea eucrina]|jgi:hypothetical protein|nr:hypothetical protein [Pantoea eucrina]
MCAYHNERAKDKRKALSTMKGIKQSVKANLL